MKISVIIPVYNVAPWLSPCLDSVLVAARRLAEHRPDCQVEVICVDDGSTDGSGKILETWAAANTQPPTPNSQLTTQIIHQANRGVAAARNAALDVATGEWLCYLDGDDLFTPEMLVQAERLVRENPECDIVHVGVAWFIDGEDPDRAAVAHLGLLTGVFCSALYRREKFRDVRFPDYLVGEDRVYAANCVFRTGRIARSDRVGYLYRQRSTSVSHVILSPRKVKDGFLHVAEMLKIAAANGRTIERSYRRQLVSQVLEEGVSNCRQLPRAERRAVERCWRACISDLRRRKLLTPWGRFVSLVVCALPFDTVTFVLCVLPYRLKKGGVHR